MKRTTKKKSNSEFIAELNQKQDNQYLCLNEYINSNTKLTFKCRECGFEFESTPHTMLSRRVGKGCKHHSKKTLKEVKKRNFCQTNKIKLVEINNSANVSGHKKLYSLIKNTLDNQLHVNPVPSL